MTMNKNLLIILYSVLFSIAFTLTSCEDGNTFDNDATPSLKAHFAYIATDNIILNHEGNATATVNVKALNTPWRFIGNEQWLSVSPSSGTEDATAKFTAEENMSGEDIRTTIVLFETTDPEWKYSKPIAVSQTNSAPYISLSESNISCSCLAVSKTINVSSNVSWTVSSNEAWVTATPSADKKSIQIDIAENTSQTQRTADITVSGAITQHIQITQYGVNVEVAEGVLYYGYAASQRSIDITTDGNWSVSASDSWIHVPSETFTGNGKLTISVDENQSEEKRTGSVMITAGEVKKVINIEQEGYVLNIDVTSIALSASGGTHRIQISANCHWITSCDADWITLSHTEGNGNVDLVLTAFENHTDNEREAIILIIGPYHVPFQIKINQATWNYKNGHEFVDLGLSVKWATCNVGAEKPEDYGLYFVWGETTGHGQNTSNGQRFDWAYYKWCDGSYNTLTKYCTSSLDGKVDNKTVLELDDDAAYINWGEAWRMPTLAEFIELETYCVWTWTTLNGLKGYKVTSKTNANSIFLPAAGCRHNGQINDSDSNGYYWSSDIDKNVSYRAHCRVLHSSYKGAGQYYRCYGLSVRAVCP